MANEYDVIILGGGCAGLSLASHLARYGNGAPRTLLLDRRATYQNDRTWCFWQLPGSYGLDLVQHRWPTVRLSATHMDLAVDCSSQPYCAIPAHHFYQHSLETIKQTPQLTLLNQTPVLGPIRRAANKWVVESSSTTYTAKNVVDTRPVGAPREGDALLWQSFLGAEVELDSECFAAGEVTLMDFRHTPQDRMVFTYVLPFSPTRALIEVTEFSPLALPPTGLQPLLTEAIKDITGASPFRTLRTESGVLPMGQSLPPTAAGSVRAETASYVRAGVAGGGARACTGYAFQRIQRWAGLCAAHLVENDLPLGHPQDPGTRAFLDQLFLRVLRGHPSLAPSLFMQLFAAAPTGSVLRFLGDQPSRMDLFRVVAALPPGPFLKALAAYCAEPTTAWRESFVS